MEFFHFLEIQKFKQQYRSPKIDDLPRFSGGLVGYFAYDCIEFIEPKLKNDSKSFFEVQHHTDTLSVNDTFSLLVSDDKNKQIKIGFLGVTLPYSVKDYVFYGDIYDEAERAYGELKSFIGNFSLEDNMRTHLPLDSQVVKILKEKE